MALRQWVFALSFLCLFTTWQTPGLAQYKCPDPNSSPRSTLIEGNKTIVTCACNPGYVNDGGQCRVVSKDAPRPTPAGQCNAGQIAARGICRSLDLGSARARVLEIKSTARSHCHAMAEIYDELSRATGANSQQLSYYVWQLLGHELSPHYVKGFTADGFAPQFRDKSDQVRHFTAYFAAAALIPGSQLYGEVYTQIQDLLEPADRELARVALALGRQARASQQQARYLGEAIRSQLCR